MGVADPAGALDVAQKFIGLLEEHKRCFDQIDSFEDLWADAKGDHGNAQEPLRERRDDLNVAIWRRLPLVEGIAKQVDPDFTNASFQEGARGTLWSWREAHASAHRLVGILERTTEEAAILGPGGPKLAAGGMHKWVWNAAADLWDGEHYREAVNAAAAAVEQHTQLKLDRGDLNGADLYTQAFKVDKPDAQPDSRRLRFGNIQERTSNGERTKNWTSAHEGAMHFGRGCAQGIRNLNVHGTDRLNEQEALGYLASLSVLARWIDDAEVREPAQPTQPTTL
ncbi:TIGR02391 family protein [Candidatus Poriferisodalis sp.]|uniref:TIGR02391 family protein n=1 Tax=Candidatus Poriferisodalis sp. TaxID=3101277 RepID=UPI003C6F62D1